MVPSSLTDWPEVSCAPESLCLSCPFGPLSRGWERAAHVGLEWRDSRISHCSTILPVPYHAACPRACMALKRRPVLQGRQHRYSKKDGRHLQAQSSGPFSIKGQFSSLPSKGPYPEECVCWVDTKDRMKGVAVGWQWGQERKQKGRGLGNRSISR